MIDAIIAYRDAIKLRGLVCVVKTIHSSSVEWSWGLVERAHLKNLHMKLTSNRTVKIVQLATLSIPETLTSI